MEAPNIWEQLFYIAIIAVSMVFGRASVPQAPRCSERQEGGSARQEEAPEKEALGR